MTIVNIYQGLIQGVVDANLSDYPVSWPNTGQPNTTNIWLRANILDMGDLPVTLGTSGLNEVSGVMQIDVFCPKLTNAYLGAINAVSEIKTILKTGADLEYNGQYIRINSAPCRPSEVEDAWYRWIITVNYTAYLNRG